MKNTINKLTIVILAMLTLNSGSLFAVVDTETI